VDDSDLLTNAEARIQKLKRLKPEKATNQPSRGKRTQSYWSIYECKIKAKWALRINLKNHPPTPC
jgi:hypothetical protein